MSKIIMIIMIIMLVYFLFLKKDNKPTTVKQENKKDTKPPSDTMVECKKCEILLSPREAILKDGQYFCSKECAKI
jgi:uncharacterized protein